MSQRVTWKALGWTIKNKDNIPAKGIETVSERKFLKEAGSFPECEP